MKSWRNRSTSELNIFFIDKLLNFNFFDRVLGYPIILELSRDEIPELPIHNRPVFNYSMRNIVAAFSGVRKREELVRNSKQKNLHLCNLSRIYRRSSFTTFTLWAAQSGRR